MVAQITVDDFISKVIPEPNSGCWLWMQNVNHCGYGTVSGWAIEKKKCMKAHRLSWRLFRGPIPDGLMVLHRCDVRCCVNPDHLFLGSGFDNAMDMIAKGRKAPPMLGSQNPRARLTAEQVREIRRSNEHKKVLAARYGVTWFYIYDILRGRSWGWLT